MTYRRINSEHGVATLEFALTASAFFMMVVVVLAGGLLFWTKNALVETTRRAARYAATQAASTPAGTVTGCPVSGNSGPRILAIRNVALYGNDAGTGSKLIGSLNADNIDVEYCNFGLNTGTVSVKITGYAYNFVVPGINRQITMPSATTTVAGESAGTTP